ncbi:hypothetical protein E2C01_042938 [Portunus trituberculatus]|uniref:SCAN box domain-containing protein n=1 Tax=Portunus trituberculatus TaxID=210409 RepID=A0A5B7FW01_PORTR|nr:hypothetical protein [Portunus trituberculatus]
MYAVRSGCPLTRKAADLYVSLSPETTKDYNALKKSLLTGFKKTTDGYRLDFRNAKIRNGENYSQFSVHLTRLFQSRLEVSQVQESFYFLKHFMIIDQFLASLNPDLRTFIKEHRPSSLDRAVQLADDWASAHYTIKPSVQCYIRCPYFESWTDVVRAPIKFASVLIGNDPGVRTPKEPYPTFSCDELVSVPGFWSASTVTLPVQSFPKPWSVSQYSASCYFIRLPGLSTSCYFIGMCCGDSCLDH